MFGYLFIFVDDFLPFSPIFWHIQFPHHSIKY